VPTLRRSSRDCQHPVRLDEQVVEPRLTVVLCGIVGELVERTLRDAARRVQRGVRSSDHRRADAVRAANHLRDRRGRRTTVLRSTMA
jgi:hypothetical protein